MLPKTMNALVFKKALHLKKVPVPKTGEGEAIVKVKLAGICNTDLEILKGYMDFQGIPGHEFVGEVVECSDQTWTGKRVVGEINFGCGHCEYCKRGMERHCPRRTVLGDGKLGQLIARFLQLTGCSLTIFEKHPSKLKLLHYPIGKMLSRRHKILRI